MFDISDAAVQEFVVHRIGNKLREESVQLSNKKSDSNDRINSILLRSYLGGTIKSESEYSFFHESDLKFNEVREFAKEIFSSTSRFLASSKKIAQHLYAASAHPNVSGGDLFVILFRGVDAYGEKGMALGIFKTEVKDTYLRLQEKDGNFNVLDEEGVNPDRLQKGVVVFEGQDFVFAIDNQTDKSKYWFDSFLKVRVTSTSARTAALACAVFKKTVLCIGDLQDSVRYKQEVLEVAGEAPSLGDLVALSGRYIGSEEAKQVAASAASALDIGYEPSSVIETKRLSKLIQTTARKLTLCDGVELVVSGGSRLKSINKNDNKNTISFVIEIEKGVR